MDSVQNGLNEVRRDGEIQECQRVPQRLGGPGWTLYLDEDASMTELLQRCISTLWNRSCRGRGATSLRSKCDRSLSCIRVSDLCNVMSSEQ
jgi:hypothetical protein